MGRRWLAAAVAMMASGLGLMLSTPASASGPRSMPLPVDRQDYVTSVSTTNPTDGSLIDPYDADPSSIHVAVNGGSEFARSFVHVALDYLPAHTSATQLTMTLHVTQQSDASNTGTYPIYNVNTSSAIIEACALTTELPQKFDYTKPPAYDCAHGSAVGTPSKAGDTFTFKLAKLVDYWRIHGNTGAALLPIPGGANNTWSIAFYKSRSAALADFAAVRKPSAGGHVQAPAPSPAPPATSVPPASNPAPAAPAPAAPAAPAVPVTGSVAAAPPAAPAVAPPAVPNPSAAAAPTTPSKGGSGGAWPWVLASSLLVSGAAIGIAHRGAVLALVRRIVPPGLAAFRAHPRAYSVAAAAAAWGLVFTGYSFVTAPATTSPSTEAAANGSSSAATSGTAPGAPTSTTGAAATAHSSTIGTSVAGGAAGSTATTTGSTVSGGGVSAPAGGTQAPNPATTEFNGPGTYRTINGIPVFFPKNGGPPVAKLYNGADDTIGLTPSTIKICAHAALTYGAAFNISASDLDVFWSDVNAHGGIFGRKVTTNYQNDNYDPGTAVQAAQTCKDWGTFLLLGGIGFDQIPAVRQWAEQNHELYLHHIATIEGSAGLRYSFSSLPTVEQVGTWMGELAAKQFPGKKVGILYRQSSNWTPGVTTFTNAVKAAGMQIVGSYGVTINQGNYTQELAQLHTAGAQVVFAWENALSEIEMIKQAQGQNWHPAWLVNGFNIITNTLGSTALDQDMWSAAEWEAYDPGYYGGGFASYAPQIHEFEAQYKKYDPNANLKGDGGDLLFLNWESQKGLYDLLTACGPQCTRNKVAGLLLAGWHKPSPPNCPVNFDRTGDHHHGGYLFSVLHAVRDPNGRANFVPVNRCIGNL